MLCPILVGRTPELTDLTAALDAAATGHGGAVFVTGEEGAGKSRLTRALCDEATARGFTVMTGRGTRSAVPVPYRPVAEALIGAARAGVTPDMSVVSNYRAALGSLVPEWSKPGDGRAHVSPVVVGEAVLRLLTQGGQKGGVLVLEDLHWADSETLDIVEYLADNVADAQVLCVVTVRSGVPSACLDLMQSALARRTATAVEVPRLSAAAVRQMAIACLGADELPAGLSSLLPATDGLPFAVEEILAAAVASGQLASNETGGWYVNSNVRTGVPASISGSVRTRLGALGPAGINVIVSAAVLGRQFDWALLPSLASVGESEVLDVLQRACEVQLVEPAPPESGTGSFRFRHSLTRDAILADLMPPELASRAAATAAAIVQANPGLPGSWCELVAELYALAGQPKPAARLLVTSGRRALLKGAVTSAVTALRDARQLLAELRPADPMLAIEVDEVLLQAFAQAGDYKQLAPLADDLIGRLRAAAADPRREALVRLRAASMRPEDAPAAAASHLAAAAAIAERLHDPELSGRVDTVAARNALVNGELDTAEQLARRALAIAEEAGLSDWAADVALESLELIGRREHARDMQKARQAFERARQVADSKDLGIWRVRARHELATIEMLRDGSASQLRDVRQMAADAGATCVGTVITLQLANLASLSAGLDDAHELAVTCQKSAALIKAPRIQAMATVLEASIAAVSGDLRRVEQAAERAEAVLPNDAEVLITTWGHSRVLASLFRDDLSQARIDNATAMTYAAQALSSPLVTHGFYSALQAPVLSPRRAMALHALLAAVADADGRAAIEQARSLGASNSWNAGCLGYAQAVLAGRDGQADAASALAAEGRAHFGPFAPWWNGLAVRLVAPAALRDGWGDPVSWLREAASGFEATSHDELASACRGILRRAGERVPRSGRGSSIVPAQLRGLGVTSREMDVYQLVGSGASNAAIAAKLYISPKTVQTHIASLVAKTGKNSRRELVAAAAGGELR